MSDNLQDTGSPFTPGLQPTTQNLTNLILVLQQLVVGQGRILQTLQGIPGILSPVYDVEPWTPALKFGGANSGMTGTFSGTYTRTGRDIFCYFAITLTAKGSSTGAATITGLPVPAGSTAGEAGAGGILTTYANLSGLTGAPIINVPTAGSTASLLQTGAAATAGLTDAAFTNTSVLAGYFRYANL